MAAFESGFGAGVAFSRGLERIRGRVGRRSAGRHWLRANAGRTRRRGWRGAVVQEGEGV